MRTVKRPLAQPVLLLVALSLASSGCSRRSEALSNKQAAVKAPEPQAPPRVEVKPAVRHTFTGRVPLTGELRPVREVSLKSRIGGNVVELRVDEGDRVKKGQLVARIEAVKERAQLEGAAAAVAVAEAQRARALAELERLERDQQRIETLYQKGAIDRKTFDDVRSSVQLGKVAVQSAEAQLRQARASRAAARNSVSETVYRAPFDGVVSRRGVQLHEYLDTMKNREIVAIVDNSVMELVAAVASDLAAGIGQGAPVEFTLSALPGQIIRGQVTAVSPVVDPRTRTVKLRVKLPNPEGRLKGGMYATGHVAVGGERQAVGVPTHALHRVAAPGGPAGEGETGAEVNVVWRVKGGVAEQVLVQTGAEDGDLVEIVRGLDVGDQVIVSSPAALRPGAPVTARVL